MVNHSRLVDNLVQATSPKRLVVLMNKLRNESRSGLTFYGHGNYTDKRDRQIFYAYYLKEMTALNIGEFE